MFGLNSADLMHKLHQQKAAQVMHEAEQSRLSLVRHPATSNGHTRIPALSVKVIIIVLLMLGLFAIAQQTFAEPPDVDAGSGDYFPEATLAYRMGHYYLISGEPDKALEWLTQAFDNIPEEVLLTVPAYQDWYWTLGEAQEAAGLWEEALISYQQWLMLAGDDAAPWAVTYVQTLEEQAAVIAIAD